VNLVPVVHPSPESPLNRMATLDSRPFLRMELRRSPLEGSCCRNDPSRRGERPCSIPGGRGERTRKREAGDRFASIAREPQARERSRRCCSHVFLQTAAARARGQGAARAPRLAQYAGGRHRRPSGRPRARGDRASGRSRGRRHADARASLPAHGSAGLFRSDDAGERRGAQIALDGALSFAESMGSCSTTMRSRSWAPGAAEAATPGTAAGIEPRISRSIRSRLLEARRDLARGAGPARSRRRRPAPAGGRSPAGAGWVLLTKFRRTRAPGRASRRNDWPIRLLSHF
jgi:hypothetical protein